MNISVVVPNWNGEDFVGDCIDSLLVQTQKCDVVVVENGSIDSSDEILKSYGSRITVLKQEVNLGFAGGVNAGIRHALKNDSQYIALLNNDAMADKDWIKQLVSKAEENQKTGIVAAKILHSDRKTIDSTGEFYTFFGISFPRGRNQKDSGQYDNKTVLFGASGGASLYSAAMLRDIGLFDEDFFAYFEDVDISFRAQLAGWNVYFAPKARVYHRISATSSRISGFGSFQTAKNIPLLYIKNMPGLLFWKYLPLVTYWYIRMFAARLVRGGFVPFLKGWLWSLRLTPKKLAERRIIQKSRIVSSAEIDKLLYQHRPPRPGEF